MEVAKFLHEGPCFFVLLAYVMYYVLHRRYVKSMTMREELQNVIEYKICNYIEISIDILLNECHVFHVDVLGSILCCCESYKSNLDHRTRRRRHTMSM